MAWCSIDTVTMNTNGTESGKRGEGGNARPACVSACRGSEIHAMHYGFFGYALFCAFVKETAHVKCVAVQ